MRRTTSASALLFPHGRASADQPPRARSNSLPSLSMEPHLRRHQAKAFAEQVRAAQSPMEMWQIIVNIDTEMLREHPHLLNAIADGLAQRMQDDPYLLGVMASVCLEAADGTNSAPSIWASLCEQLRGDLPLTAARSLRDSLDAKREQIPEDALPSYLAASTYMDLREKATPPVMWAQLVPGHFAERASSLPTLPSHINHRL